MNRDAALVELVRDALSLASEPFARGSLAALSFEFYHQLRKLWDRGIPVGMGLGHLLIATTDSPLSLVIVRLAEAREPGGRAAVVTFQDADSLRYAGLGAGTILVAVGAPASLLDLPPPPAGVTLLRFDTAHWMTVPKA